MLGAMRMRPGANLDALGFDVVRPTPPRADATGVLAAAVAKHAANTMHLRRTMGLRRL